MTTKTRKTETKYSRDAVYLLTPLKLVERFILEADRNRFAVPVEVEVLRAGPTTGSTIVREKERGIEYPVDREWLRKGWELPCPAPTKVRGWAAAR